MTRNDALYSAILDMAEEGIIFDIRLLWEDRTGYDWLFWAVVVPDELLGLDRTKEVI